MKLKSATLSLYQSVDGYEESKYQDIEVPDNFDELDASDQAEILEGFTPVSNEFYVRKVFNCEYDEAEVEYEV